MRIGQAWDNGVFMEVDRPLGVKFLGGFVRADEDDAALLDRNRFRVRFPEVLT